MQQYKIPLNVDSVHVTIQMEHVHKIFCDLPKEVVLTKIYKLVILICLNLLVCQVFVDLH